MRYCKVAEVANVSRQSKVGRVFVNHEKKLKVHIEADKFKTLAECVHSYTLHNGYVYFSDSGEFGALYQVDIDTGEKKVLEGRFVTPDLKNFSKKRFLLTIRDVGSTIFSIEGHHRCVVGIQTFELFEKAPAYKAVYHAYTGDLIAGVAPGGIIFATKNLSPNFLWQVQLPEGEKTNGTMQIYQDVLVVGTQIDGETRQDYLSGYNLHTGEALWREQAGTDIYLDEYTGLIHSLNCLYYRQRDALTGKLVHCQEFKPDLRESHKAQLIAHKMVLEGDGLYFTTAKTPQCNEILFGKFNVVEKCIEFIQPLETDDPEINVPAPVVHKNYIYIVDSNNTLHVYEKN